MQDRDPTTWNSPGGQAWCAAEYARTARFVAELGAPVLDLLDPQPGERVLDLGCGDGALTRRIAERGATVLGVDASADMVRAARDAGLAAEVVDGHDLRFAAEFDAVFSNAALHWMRQPDAVLAGVARSLRPGGRFVAELGGHGNVAAVSTALVAVLARRGVDGWARRPWYFPTPEEYGARLRSAGFVVEEAVLVPRPTPLPGDLADWLGTFAAAFLGGLADAERAVVVAEVRDLLRPCLWSPERGWTVDYVRLRVAARLPDGRPAPGGA